MVVGIDCWSDSFFLLSENAHDQIFVAYPPEQVSKGLILRLIGHIAHHESYIHIGIHSQDKSPS